jgi:ADP-ribose pyrophosphatase
MNSPAEHQPSPDHVIKSEVVFSGKKATLRLDTIELETGNTSVREIVEHPGVVAVVPLGDDGRVMLVRQYRLAANGILLEIPAGVMDPGESPEQAAQRELAEEIGMRAGRLTSIGGFFVSPGISTEFIQLYLGEALSPSEASADEDEDIVVTRLSLASALDLVASGEICDAKTITGLLLVARLRAE